MTQKERDEFCQDIRAEALEAENVAWGKALRIFPELQSMPIQTRPLFAWAFHAGSVFSHDRITRIYLECQKKSAVEDAARAFNKGVKS